MGAIFSPCKTYRYVLSRRWDTSLPSIVWIGLNPSTADATNDDPTIRRVVGFSKAWGYGTAYMLNLFAFRATNPKYMKAAADPIGPLNDAYLKKACATHSVVVCAWGSHGTFRNRNYDLDAWTENRHIYFCLGRTASDQPKHPLYLPLNTQLEPFYRKG